MSVSLICACKDREKSLTISLMSWLMFSEITEIIIVDWSSSSSLEHLTFLDKRIKIITVPNQIYFNQPQPLNLAADLSTSEKILKVDCDHIFNPYYNFFEDYSIDKNTCFCGNNSRMEDVYRGLWGLLYVTRENFLKVGGFNEEMGEYYSYEDDEIISRLKFMGIKVKQIIPETHRVLHLAHPSIKRVENFKGNSTNKSIKEFESEQRNILSKKYSGEVLERKLSIILSCKHNEINRNLYGNKEILSYYVNRKYNWDIKKINDQNFIAIKK